MVPRSRRRILTVFGLSTENIRRATRGPAPMHLFAENFRRVGDDERESQSPTGVPVSVFGNREGPALPMVYEAMSYAEGRTEQYDQYRATWAVAYGGREKSCGPSASVVLTPRRQGGPG